MSGWARLRSARRAGVGAVAVLALLLAGCSADTGTPGTRFVVGQLSTGVTDPIQVSLVGLQPGQNVTVSARRSVAGQQWSSQAVYVVPPSGAVDLGTARPVLASYPLPDGAGLFWTLAGPPQSQTQLEHTWAGGDLDIRLVAVQSGHEVATAIVHRLGLSGFSTLRSVFAGDILRTAPGGDPGVTGFDVRIGTFYRPDTLVTGLKPAVILIDGDEGGASAPFIAGQLAQAGFPTFVLPAFGPEGQIPGSSALSVEAFDSAVTWLRRQPNVDPFRIFTFGSWRAAPLALWLAAEEPQRIYGAIGVSGPTALLCQSPDGAPTITEDGVGVPCEDGTRTIADVSLIPLDRIPGPVLLACGDDDAVLATACNWWAAGLLDRKGRQGDDFVRGKGAGHAIAVPPLLPVDLQDLSPTAAQATERTRVAFWSGVLLMLQAASR